MQSILAIKEFAQRVNTNNWAAVIFPEGTRSRDGVPKTFKRKGLETLFEQMPDAVIIPLAISNSWKTLRYGKFPMGIGAHIKLTVKEPINVNTDSSKEIINKIEAQITKHVTHEQ